MSEDAVNDKKLDYFANLLASMLLASPETNEQLKEEHEKVIERLLNDNAK